MNEEVLKMELEGEEGEDFAALLEQSFKEEENDQKLIEGVIVKINGEDVLVDVGMKSEGRLKAEEITDAEGNLLFKEGDKIEVLVTGAGSERCRISYKRAQRQKKSAEFIEAHKDELGEMEITGMVTRKNAGGYIVESGDLEFFMPRSLAAFRPDAKPIGREVTARVVKMDENTGSIVISRRAILNDVRKARREVLKKLVDDAEVVEGTIKRIKSYGMFVEVDGVEGLVHYSEISYKGPVNPSSMYNEGDKVPVKAIDYDKEKKRLSLSIKATQPDPWEEIGDQLEVGDAIKVVVTNLENYGAFVDLGNEIEGFLHISELSWQKNIKHPSEVVSVGDEIDVEVIELDLKNRKLRVSLKALQPKPFETFSTKFKEGDKVTGTVTTLKDFGAFVKIGEVEGLLHNEDASWERNIKCKDAYKPGDEVEVVITKIDKEKERISLSRKVLEESPIDKFAKDHKNGDILKGTIRDIKDFGVFVRLEGGIDALIRTEDLGTKKPEELNNGDEIEGVLVLVDPKKNRVRLSIRRLARQQERESLEEFNRQEEDSETTMSEVFKEAMKK